MCTNKGDKSEFIFTRIMPRFGLRIFNEKAATSRALAMACSALVSPCCYVSIRSGI